ncbi:hypothetical protein U2F26_30200 [Micromonospora sp. 4G57]|uniref:hypothetical protein n=1 Tax=Micromonospora sp. GCM10011541 TaxID=3317336 RepID=UPI002ACAFBE7|nr:hypothetical protein [Micromonospora sp. 4G57]
MFTLTTSPMASSSSTTPLGDTTGKCSRKGARLGQAWPDITAVLDELLDTLTSDD